MPLAEHLVALGLDFDPDEMKKKYREERDKRIRPDGNEQVRNPSGVVQLHPTSTFRPLNHPTQYIDISTHPEFLIDPYTKAVPRPANTEEIECVILGGGFGGILAAVRLIQRGVTNFKIVEKAGDFGGTCGLDIDFWELWFCVG